VSQTPVTVTYSLEEVLKEINQKLDTLQKDVTEIKVGQIKLETEVVALKENISNIAGSQKAQIWTLIGVLGTAVVGTVIRFVITALPGNP
jgi:hypothetical protein